MSSASDLQTIFGSTSKLPPPPAVEWRGKTLRARHFKQHQKNGFVAWLKEEAKRELELDRKIVPPEEFEQRRRELQSKFDRGYYGYYSPISIERQKTPDGLVKMISLVFDISEDEALFVLAESPEAMAAFNQVVADSFPAASATANGAVVATSGEEVAAKND